MPYADPDRQRAYVREWMQRRRAEWINENGPCTWCGSWEDPQVDHRDPKEKIDHKLWSWSAPRRAAELAKCQVLCKPCHKKKSAAEVRARTLARLPEHGTRARYAMAPPLGCHCDACRAGAARYTRELRARRKARLVAGG